MNKTVNWLLYETHRWLGIVLAVFMFGWFFSGLAIMYAKPAATGIGEQRAHAEALQLESGWLSAGEAWTRSADQRKALAEQQKVTKKPEATAANSKPAAEVPLNIADARLLRRADLPVWLIEDTRGRFHALSAVDGSVQQFNPEQAKLIANRWLQAEGNDQSSQLQLVETLDKTTMLRNREAWSPFHKIEDQHGRQWLISARTGEVLHASDRVDRALYYVGNWLHLFKPLEDLGLGEYRHDVQLWSGFGATIACLTGMIIGWLRWRPGFGGKPTYSQGRTQPYRESWAKWHFWSGLLGGTLALTWALSGYLDTNPGKIFSEANPGKPELARYLGDGLPNAIRDWQPAIESIADNAAVVELNWRRLADTAVLVGYDHEGQRIQQSTINGAAAKFAEAELLAAVARLTEGAAVVNQELLENYDGYYYPRHHQGLSDKPLPVLKVELADQAGSYYYLDPQDGKLLQQVDSSRRVMRWLYSALHHWDFGWLYYRPVWDVWMLIWVGFGVVLGATSVVTGWRRLKKTFKRKKSSLSDVPVSTELATETSS
jgi:uncharacterized iron-regulated membrane protein